MTRSATARRRATSTRTATGAGRVFATRRFRWAGELRRSRVPRARTGPAEAGAQPTTVPGIRSPRGSAGTATRAPSTRNRSPAASARYAQAGHAQAGHVPARARRKRARRKRARRRRRARHRWARHRRVRHRRSRHRRSRHKQATHKRAKRRRVRQMPRRETIRLEGTPVIAPAARRRLPRALGWSGCGARPTGQRSNPALDIVFVPSVSEMYPSRPRRRRPRSRCAASARPGKGLAPGDFDGVATVVAKLFSVAGPCRAYLGRTTSSLPSCAPWPPTCTCPSRWWAARLSASPTASPSQPQRAPVRGRAPAATVLSRALAAGRSALAPGSATAPPWPAPCATPSAPASHSCTSTTPSPSPPPRSRARAIEDPAAVRLLIAGGSAGAPHRQQRGARGRRRRRPARCPLPTTTRPTAAQVRQLERIG